MSEVLRDRVSAVAASMGVEDCIFAGNSEIDEGTVVERFVNLFDERPDLFRKFLYPIFDKRIRAGLETIASLDKFGDQTPIKEIFPPRYLKGDFKELGKQTGLVLPEPMLSNLSLFVSLGLFLGTCGLAVIAVIIMPEIFIVLFGLIKTGVILIVLAIPSVAAHFLFPALSRDSSLGDIHTYRELIEYVVRRNYYSYVDNRYWLTRRELRLMFEIDS
jgi:hypothetical protein